MTPETGHRSAAPPGEPPPAAAAAGEHPAAADPVEIATELRAVLGRLVRRMRADNALALPQALVLGRLEREGPRCVAELAAAEHVRPQSMAQTVRELEGEGLIRRQTDPGDRRRARIELTDRGSTVLAAERARREGWLAAALERDLSEAERRVLGQAAALFKRLAGD